MTDSRPLLAGRDLWRSYRRRSPWLAKSDSVMAVRGVDIAVDAGESVAVVGRSGSGKSTLARLLLGLEKPDRGAVIFAGTSISNLPHRHVRPLRRRFQAVFQDPSASLDPCLRVATIVGEPLAAHGIGSSAARMGRVTELLHSVGLPEDAAGRFPDEFSGGERQRIAIARAIAPEPDLLILDEPLSSLDATVQLRVLNLIRDLRDRLGLALIMISHDLAIVGELCDRTLVMDQGVIVESGRTAQILRRPEHEATRRLVAALNS